MNIEEGQESTRESKERAKGHEFKPLHSIVAPREQRGGIESKALELERV